MSVFKDYFCNYEGAGREIGVLGAEERECGRVQQIEPRRGEREEGEGKGTRGEEGEGRTGKECEIVR